MDCKQCGENLTAFLDGELRSSDSTQLCLHLNLCPSCADELRTLKESADFITSHCRHLDPHPESWNMVRARLSAVDSTDRFRFFAPNRWRIAVVWMAIVAAMGIGYGQYRQYQSQNLKDYMTQYIQDREARSPFQSVKWNANADFRTEAPYADNPFVEIISAATENPFSSELHMEEE
jgi:hypothetical protein